MIMPLGAIIQQNNIIRQQREKEAENQKKEKKNKEVGGTGIVADGDRRQNQNK